MRISKISQGRHLVRVAAGVVSLVYLALVPARLLALDGRPTVLLAASALLATTLLAAFWHLLRPTDLSPAQLEVLTTLLCLVPVVDTLIVLLLTGRMEQSAILMLVMIGAGAVVSTGRAMLLLAGSTGVLWGAVVQLTEAGSSESRTHYGLLMVASIGLAVLVFLLRTAGDRALREAKSQMNVQWEELVRTQGSRAESERRFREVFDASPVGIGLADEFGHYVEINQAWCELLGRDRSELLGRSSREFTHPDDLQQHSNMSQRQDELEDGVVRVEKRYLRPDGTVRWAWLSMTAVHGPTGQTWTLAHAQDVTDRKETEAALQRSEAAQTAAARIARCVQSGEDPRPIVAAAVLELAGAVAVALLEKLDTNNLVLSEQIGIPTARRVIPLIESSASAKAWHNGRPLFVTDPATEPLARQAFARLPTAKTMLWQPVLDKGLVIAMLVVGWERQISRLDDRAVRAVAGLADETASALTALRLRQELEASAETDPLTGVLNRRGWQSGAQELIAQAQGAGEPVSFALIDFDHFKDYNDTYGHHQGDLLLREFAAQARQVLRERDLIARWGGEEFAVAIPGLSAHDVELLLDKLRTLMPAGQSCSIGFAGLLPGETSGECLRRADSALYQAKRSGRDRVVGI